MEMNLESQVACRFHMQQGISLKEGHGCGKTSRRVKQRHQQEATGIASCDGNGSGCGKSLVCTGHGVKASF